MASPPPRMADRRGAASTSATSAASAPSVSSAALPYALRVGGLPSALSDDAVRSLIAHYGAARVRVLRRKRAGDVLHGRAERAASMAIAEFADRGRWQDALQRLAKVQLAGKRLTVEAVGGSGTDDGGTEEKDRQEPTNSAQSDPVEPPRRTAGLPRELPRPPPVGAPLAPHLGLHYAPSPLLQYKYPKATVPVVRNIANALIALPRFYTQVLHLMNKMNLPTPFEPGAIPGRFSEEFMPEARPQRQPQHTDQFVEEDEDEEAEGLEKEPPEHTPPDNSVLPAAKRARHSMELKAVTGKKRPRVAIGAGSTSTPIMVEIDTFKPPRPGVISSAELDRQRVPEAARASDPAFAQYAIGKPSIRVLITNVAESVDANDLQYVLGHVIPPHEPLASMRIERQATDSTVIVSLPTLECAERAVALINGVVVNGQPLIVRYAASETPADTTSPLPGESTLSVSETETKWERMDPEALALEKAMKNYQRGDPTTALYIKNLAKAVDETVLRDLCRPLLPFSVSPDTLTIRHFAEGRMKNQAFIEFPSPDVAATVLESIHGLVVHGKPLVVSFRKAQPAERIA